MDFAYADEHLMLRDTVREFALRRLEPIASQFDERQEFPWEAVREAAAMGLLGLLVPEEYNGAGVDTVGYAIAIEELSRVWAAFGVIVSVNNSLACWPILAFGTEEQKRRFLPPLAQGVKLGSYALTEPSSGSDAGSLQMVAERVPGGYRLRGTKVFVTNGANADITITFARTDPQQGSKGISAFVVERPSAGLSVVRKEVKLGIRASDTAVLSFEDVFVPSENRLGQEGEGFRIALATLEGGRIGIAAQALGIAQGALDKALAYSLQREQFGQRIASFQAIQFKLADMATQIEAARLLTYRAAWMKDQGLKAIKEASMAKLFASDVAMMCSREAVQILGGYGYTADYPVERFYRDAKITEIYEGTSEIQRLVISREILRQAETGGPSNV
jgi:alkylation response protein AidB-like acyl-CoA dehydrogenase